MEDSTIAFLIMIVSYIACIFINRTLNFYMVKNKISNMGGEYNILPFVWFCWFITFVFYTCIIINFKFDFKNSKIIKWFLTGNWNNVK
jgi:hypothetical protein